MSAKRRAEIALAIRRAIAALPKKCPITAAALRRTGNFRRPKKQK